MSGADLFVDGFPHGTPGGFELGCRGGACPNGVGHGQTCRQASVRYAGDFTYRRLVDAGAPLEKLQLPESFVAEVKPKGVKRRVPSLDEARPATVLVDVARAPKPKVKPAPVEKPKRGESHGTMAGYRRGCHKGSPCPGGADGRTCAQVMSEYQANWAKEKKESQEREAAAAAVVAPDVAVDVHEPAVDAPAPALPSSEMQRAFVSAVDALKVLAETMQVISESIRRAA